MVEYKNIAGELKDCLRVLTEILEKKLITEREDLRLKYVTKTIDQVNEQIIKTSEIPLYIFHKQKLVGKLTDAELTIDITLLGTYTLTPMTDKGVLVAYNLEEKI